MLGMPMLEPDVSQNISYWVAQRERTKDRKLHIQGYMEFTKPMSLKALRDVLPAHWEPRKGTQKQAIDYCKKEESRDTDSFANGDLIDAGPWEDGSTKRQGARNDIKKVVDLLKAGASDRTLLDEAPAYLLRYGRGIDRLRSAVLPPPPEFRKVKTLVLWGNPGVGKSRYARQLDPKLYSLWDQTANWFDGYNGEQTLLIDEFKCAIPITKLNSLLDGYKLTLPIKGGTTVARWMFVIIISNINPTDWYGDEHNDVLKRALYRRLGNIRQISDSGAIENNTGVAVQWDLPAPLWTPLSPPDEDDKSTTFIPVPETKSIEVTTDRCSSPTPSITESELSTTDTIETIEEDSDEFLMSELGC